MKRVVLTDFRTKAMTIFENPPWRLGSITSAWVGTFDVRMIHEDGGELTIDVKAEKVSLTDRSKAGARVRDAGGLAVLSGPV